MNKATFNIGFDVASKKTGVAVTLINKKGKKTIIYASLLLLDEKLGFSGDKGSRDSINIAIETEKILHAINAFMGANKYKPEDVIVNVAYERSNHGFRRVAEVLATYVGMIQGILSAQLAGIGISALQGNINQKYVSPNEWGLQTIGKKYTVAPKTKEDKHLRKKWSIDFANNIIGETKLSYDKIGKGDDDVADAICISWVADKLVDTSERTKAKTKRKHDTAKNLIRINRISAFLLKLKEKMIDKERTLMLKTKEGQVFEHQHWTKYITRGEDKARYKKWIQELVDLKADNKIIAQYALVKEGS